MSRPESFSLTRFSEESLLLDLGTGSLFHLNESASQIWSDWLAGESEEAIARKIESRYGLQADEAMRHVNEALKVTEGGSDVSAVFEYLYERTGTGYTFSKDEVPLLTIDERGQWLKANSSAFNTRVELLSVLLSVSPKLAALRGHFVLHASAAVVGDHAIAFCGLSGAGKTTTVRALVAAGAQQVCEDKLIVRRGLATSFEAVSGAEVLIRRWAEDSLEDLLSNQAVSCEPLGAIADGPGVRLTEIGFISAGARLGDQMTGSALSTAEAAGRIFSNLFYGSELSKSWRTQLQRAVDLAANTNCSALAMPNGIGPLRQAATDLVRRGSLRA